MTENKNPHLGGQILLAMPGMADPRFHRAVIYLCAHDPGGAMGLVINQPVPGLEFGKLVDQLPLEDHINVPPHIQSMPVMAGGPVESARGFVLHGPDFEGEGTIKINDEFRVTGTLDALKDIASGSGPARMIFALGYAGWTAGQLDQEIQQNAWLIAPASNNLIFDTPVQNMWDTAVTTLGINPAQLSLEAGQA